MSQTLRFPEWSEEVQKEITRIGRAMGNSNVVLDASIGYRLGWSPNRMAKALLIYDRKDYGVLLDITAGRLSLATVLAGETGSSQNGEIKSDE